MPQFKQDVFAESAIDADDLDTQEETDDEEDAVDMIQYPWPCPQNWPLAPSLEQDTKTNSPESTSDVYVTRSYSPADSSTSPTKAQFDDFESPHRETSPLKLDPETPLQPLRTASMVKFSKVDATYQTPRIKIVQIPSPIKDSRPLDSWEDDMVPDMQSTGYTGTARSITSTTSSRRRNERFSALETFNRQHSKSGVPEERRIFFTSKFKSRRITEPVMKPWKDEKDPRLRAIAVIPLLGILVGFMVGAYLIYSGYKGVPKHNFCQILNEDWSNGIDPNTWTREVNLGGFGTGEFEWATDSDDNSFVKDGKLHIHPTLTSDNLGTAAVLDDYTIDLTTDGSCTGTTASECIATSNSTQGAILPPVQSARLVSKGKFSMKYGKIEIKARMPRGDWLWPAIWMLPEDNVYGAWPLSGEIDIAEGRGNSRSYASGGRNLISSTLHWGPSTVLDAFYRTNNANEEFHSDYTSKFFTFGLEWTDKYLYTYIDNHLRQVFYIKFDEPFFQRGQWSAIDRTNKTAIVNPWAGAHNNIAPFDQSFYLILNVAVGTSFGFFPDNVGNKPWVDGTATAKQNFYSAKDTWYPTWGAGDHRDMVVDHVKAWKLC